MCRENERVGAHLLVRNDILEFWRSHIRSKGPRVEPRFARNNVVASSPGHTHLSMLHEILLSACNIERWVWPGDEANNVVGGLERIRNTEVLFNNPCSGVNYGSCIRASYGCFQLCIASYGATYEPDGDFVTSILKHTVGLPKSKNMHTCI